MLRKIGVYFTILLVGLFLGYIFFGDSESDVTSHQNMEINHTDKWTCSMHPKVIHEREGKCPVCAMDLVLVQDISSELNDSQFEMSVEALALANTETLVISSVNSHKNELIRLSGKIYSNKKTDAVQTSLFDGRIEKLYANTIGAKIYKGQKIGFIYAPDLYLAQDKLLGSISYRETHKNLYDAARNTAGLWKMTDAQIDTMLAQGKPIVNFPIYSEVSGTIVNVSANEGDFYKEGDPLFRTSDLRSVWAVFDAYENQLDNIEVGQEVNVFVKGSSTNKISAKVNFIEPIMDETKRTVAVRVVLKNNNGILKPGMFAEATLTSKANSSTAVMIPKKAVLWTGKRSVVYLKPLKDKPVFEFKEIELGKQIGDYYEVLDGLVIGDEVVVEGTFTIDAAAELAGKKSMMSATNENEKLSDKMDAMEMKLPINVNVTLKENFELFLEAYMKLKNSLIESNHKLSSENAIEFHDQLKSNFLLGEKSMLEIKEIEKALILISQSKNIEIQRKSFHNLSEIMMVLTAELKNINTTIYVQHCDCFDDNSGGTWLSYSKEILNPFYGKKMLTCGKIQQVLN